MRLIELWELAVRELLERLRGINPGLQSAWGFE